MTSRQSKLLTCWGEDLPYVVAPPRSREWYGTTSRLSTQVLLSPPHCSLFLRLGLALHLSIGKACKHVLHSSWCSLFWVLNTIPKKLSGLDEGYQEQEDVTPQIHVAHLKNKSHTLWLIPGLNKSLRLFWFCLVLSLRILSLSCMKSKQPGVRNLKPSPRKYSKH